MWSWTQSVISLLCMVAFLVTSAESSSEDNVHTNELVSSKTLRTTSAGQMSAEIPMTQEMIKPSLISQIMSKRNDMQTRRQLSGGSLDEQVKENCCRRAFDLCEPPPHLKPRQWSKRQLKNLGRAKKACRPLSVFDGRRVTQQAICRYYSGHPTNCAMTPQSPDDFDRYEVQLKRCCDKAPSMCDDMGNELLLFELKRECHWFAKNTAEEICSLDGGFECSDEWLGNQSSATQSGGAAEKQP